MLVYDQKNPPIVDPNGVSHIRLDMAASDFLNDPALCYGRKVSPTFAFRAQAGQKVITSQGKNVETVYQCKGDEVVFVNRLPSGAIDLYVPRDAEGRSVGEAILNKDYKKLAGTLTGRGGVYQPAAGTPSILLFEVIQQPTVIADAYGPGAHVFLAPGATLKVTGAHTASGINKAAFDATWALTDETGATIVRPARPPSADFYELKTYQSVLGL
jgi:hypothetical protein